MIRRAGLVALLVTLPSCAGGPGVEDPLAPIPGHVDEADVAPPGLRPAWSVEVELEGREGRGTTASEEDEAAGPTMRPALGTANAYLVFGRRLVALELEEGSVRWEVSAPGPVVLSPVVVGEDVAIASEGSWTFIDAAGRVVGALRGAGTPVAATAAAGRLVEIRDAEVRAVVRDPQHGPGVAWARPLEGASSVTATEDGSMVLVVDEAGVLHALAVASGERRWSQDGAAALAGAIAVGEGRAFVAGRDRFLRAVRLRDGKVDWRSRSFGVDLAGAPAVADGVVWVGGMTTALQGLDADSGSNLFRVRIASRSYLDLVRWGHWVVASPSYGPWTVVRAPLRQLGPANPGTPVVSTIPSEGNEIALAPAAGPRGVLLVDAGGTVRLLTPQEHGPIRSPGSSEGRQDAERDG